MPGKARFSESYEAKRARIRRLPTIVNQMMDSMRKRDAVQLIETYQEGLRKNNFNLERLKPQTVQRKMARGGKRPKAPLYFRGDDEKNSYVNMLKMVKLKKGYRVMTRTAKHHEADMSLRELWSIHEHGATIRGRGGSVIRIPPRPALHLAQQRFLKHLKRQEPTREVRKAINEVMRTGKSQTLAQIRKQADRESRRHEE